MILLIKELSCKAIAQFNLKGVIKNHTHPKDKNETQRISTIVHRILQVVVHHLCNKSNLLQDSIIQQFHSFLKHTPFQKN